MNIIKKSVKFPSCFSKKKENSNLFLLFHVSIISLKVDVY